MKSYYCYPAEYDFCPGGGCHGCRFAYIQYLMGHSSIMLLLNTDALMELGNSLFVRLQGKIFITFL